MEQWSHPTIAGVCEEHALVNSLRAGVLAFRDDGVVVRANPGAARILRREASELIGRAVDQVLAPIASLRTAKDEPETGRPEIEIRRGDGSSGTIGFSDSRGVQGRKQHAKKCVTNTDHSPLAVTSAALAVA